MRRARPAAPLEFEMAAGRINGGKASSGCRPDIRITFSYTTIELLFVEISPRVGSVEMTHSRSR